MKKIRLSKYAKLQCIYRGASEDEVCETINTSQWNKTELDKLECRKNFIYKKEWNGKFYETKQVRPIFVEEKDEIVVITVYVYYF